MADEQPQNVNLRNGRKDRASVAFRHCVPADRSIVRGREVNITTPEPTRNILIYHSLNINKKTSYEKCVKVENIQTKKYLNDERSLCVAKSAAGY